MASCNTDLAVRSSISVLTSGNIMRMLPTTLARNIARSCVRNIGRCLSARRMLRRPRNGLRSSSGAGRLGILSAPRSIGPHDDRLAFHRLGHLGIGGELLFLGRLVVAGEEQKLGAIEADAVGAAFVALLDFVGELDVAQELNPHAVERLGRQVAERFELAGLRTLLVDLVAIAGDRLLVRMQDHQALVAVDDHRLAAGNFRQERSGADDGRNAERLGDDRRVAAGPANFGDEAADESSD